MPPSPGENFIREALKTLYLPRKINLNLNGNLKKLSVNMIYVSSLGKHLKKLKLFCNTEMSELNPFTLFRITAKPNFLCIDFIRIKGLKV
jgi:hypothetical protein